MEFFLEFLFLSNDLCFIYFFQAHFLSHVEYCLISCQDQLKVKFIPEASERFVLGSPR